MQTIKNEIQEVRDSYFQLENNLQNQSRKQGYGNSWANKAVAGALALPYYAVNHLMSPAERKKNLRSRFDPKSYKGSKQKGSAGSLPPQKSFEMPNQGKSKKQKPRPKGKPGKKKMPRKKAPGRLIRNTVSYARGRKPRSSVRMSNAPRKSAESAPVSYGWRAQDPGTFTFSQGSRPGCLVMSGKWYVGALYNFTNGSSQTAAVLTCNDVNSTAAHPAISQFMVMPQNTFYSHPMIANMAQMFERYRMRTKLEFKSTSNTSDRGVLKLAYYEDPVSFYSQTAKTGFGNTTGNPNISDMTATADLAMNNSLTEATIWKSFSTNWSTLPRQQEMRYIGAITYSSWIDPITMEAVDIRQPVQGMWAISSSGFGLGTANSFNRVGELWVHFNLELCDILSAKVSTTLTSRAPMFHGKTHLSSDVDEKLEKMSKMMERFNFSDPDTVDSKRSRSVEAKRSRTPLPDTRFSELTLSGG